jgi:DMSO reductase family type II enzyme heme b subunit
MLDDYPFDMPLYRSRLKGKDTALPDFQTARAAGNQNARPDVKATASHLAATGFGTTTFLPRPSQLVSAQAEWKDAHWTVIFRRPLAVMQDEGVSLASEEMCSIGFALWFGEMRDRNGQKLVSIWHDLKLSK